MTHRITYYCKLAYLLVRHQNPMGHQIGMREIGMMARMEFRPNWLRP